MDYPHLNRIEFQNASVRLVSILLVRVQALENQSGWLPAPAYDSGWVNISQSELLTLNHNLNNTDVMVYVIGKAINFPSLGVHQAFYGGVYGQGRGIRWQHLTENEIEIKRYDYDAYWEQVRVQIWKIDQP